MFTDEDVLIRLTTPTYYFNQNKTKRLLRNVRIVQEGTRKLGTSGL